MSLLDSLKGLAPSREDFDTLRKYGDVIKENAGKPGYFILPLVISSACGFARGLAGNTPGANYATDVAIAAGIVSGVKIAGTTFFNHFMNGLLENDSKSGAAEHALASIWVPSGVVATANFGAYEGFRKLGELSESFINKACF